MLLNVLLHSHINSILGRKSLGSKFRLPCCVLVGSSLNSMSRNVHWRCKNHASSPSNQSEDWIVKASHTTCTVWNRVSGLLFASLLFSHSSLSFFGVCNLANYVSGRFCDKTLVWPTIQNLSRGADRTSRCRYPFPFKCLSKDFIIILRLSRGSKSFHFFVFQLGVEAFKNLR